MNMELLMQYVTYLLMAIGVLAFLTSVITQVIKEMPGLKKIQIYLVATGGWEKVAEMWQRTKFNKHK